MSKNLHLHIYDQKVYETVRDELLSRPRQLLEQGVLCKNGSRGYAAQVTLAGRPFFLKQYYAKHGIYRLVDYIRGSRGWRTWRTNIRMYEAGVVVPRPLVYLEERTWGVWHNGYLLSEFVEGPGDLRSVWMSSDYPGRRGLIESAGALIAGLHRRGFIHGDLKWNNILCARRENGIFLVLSDLDGASRCRTLRSRRMSADLDRFFSDLLVLSPGEEHKELFVSAYNTALNNLRPY